MKQGKIKGDPKASWHPIKEITTIERPIFNNGSRPVTIVTFYNKPSYEFLENVIVWNDEGE